MVKSIGFLIGGIFVGAVGMEIVHKRCPKAIDKLYKKSCEVSSAAKQACMEAKEAFIKGYRGAVQPNT